jgi:hypothetical protein
MPPACPETCKLDGICYAVTDDGLELPVVDITHDAFRERTPPERLAAIAEESIRSMEQSRGMPPEAQRAFLQHSIIARGTMLAVGGVLDGLTTYLYKLGPAMLGSAYAGDIDRLLLGSIAPLAVRLRLRAMVRLQEDALRGELRARPGARLTLVDLGGGAATDAINTLLLLRAGDPSLLALRAARIVLLERDTAVARFAARCVEALRDAEGPLNCCDVDLRHLPYDWNDPSPLAAILEEAAADGGITAVSSEGALFEYGSDDAMRTTLSTIARHTPHGTAFTISLLREDPVAEAIQRMGRSTLRVLGIGTLREMLQNTPWRIAAMDDVPPLYHVARLEMRGAA